jgi:hypothetical protein
MSLHWYHEKLKGPVPTGLVTAKVPFCNPEPLQNIKIGSLTPGAEG